MRSRLSGIAVACAVVAAGCAGGSGPRDPVAGADDSGTSPGDAGPSPGGAGTSLCDTSTTLGKIGTGVCATGNGGCDPNARCVERGETRVCICMPWYVGNGLSCVPGATQVGSPWPMERGNPGRTGQSAYLGPRKGVLKWTRSSCTGPIVDADGTVCVGIGSGFFDAFSPEGDTKWWVPNPVGENVPTWSTAALGSNGMLYMPGWTPPGMQGLQGHLYDYDLNAMVHVDLGGSIVTWPTFVTSHSTSSLPPGAPNLGADGTVYVFAGREEMTDSWGPRTLPAAGKLYAFHPPTGEPLWTFDTGPASGSVAVGLDGTVFVATDRGVVLAIGADGHLLWSGATTGSVPATLSPVIGADGTVYLGCNLGFVYAFDPATGAVRSSLVANGVLTLALGADETLYVGTENEGLLAIDAASVGGAVAPRWSASLQAPAFGVDNVVIGADGMVYATSDRVSAICPDGSLAWSSAAFPPRGDWEGGFYPPAIGADGTLYVGHNCGLYAFGDEAQ